jgi:hypothetical protein
MALGVEAMISVCSGWIQGEKLGKAPIYHDCGRLLALRCPAGHEHRFPDPGVPADVAQMLLEIGLKCAVQECRLPVSVEEVNHGACPECLAKAWAEMEVAL